VDRPLVTYKYSCTASYCKRLKNIVALIHCVNKHQIISALPLFELAWPRVDEFQHLAPTICVSKNYSHDGPKKATSKATTSIDDAAKMTLLAKKKGKAALADDIPHEAFEDEAVNSKRPRHDNTPTPVGTIRTCNSEGLPRAPPPGFTP
jgi:N-acetylmuramoyl-L-alanine amidase CwlA